MQKLILPIQNMLLTAGYRNVAYQKRFGFAHYGHDSISTTGNQQVFASGDGKVLAAGADSLLGNVLILLYFQVCYGQPPLAADLILRYCHLDSIAVKQGALVAPGTVLGVYGKTGRYSTGPHLHMEADLDTKYFAYSATVGKDGSLIKAGTSRTMCNPADLLHVGASQKLTGSKASFGGLPYVISQDLATALSYP